MMKDDDEVGRFDDGMQDQDDGRLVVSDKPPVVAVVSDVDEHLSCAYT